MKKMIDKILFPSWIVGFFLFNIGFGLLIYVFTYHLEETLLAYVSYSLSFYALVIFCLWFYQMCKTSYIKIKNSRMYALYEKHFLKQSKTLVYLSSTLNLLYGIFELGVGIYDMSWWFITLAIYYLFLCLMKLSLIRHVDHDEKAYQRLKHAGMMLLFLNLVLVGMIILMIEQDKTIHYHGYLIYLMALYDFYLIMSAIVNVVKYRKNHRPMIIASKCIHLTIAMISMLSLEVAMVYQFGHNDVYFKQMMTASMGLVICLMNTSMAIYMIKRANCDLKENHL